MEKYNLKQDHERLKKQIKSWELELDRLYKAIGIVYDDSTLGDIKADIQPSIENLSHEMMAINL